MGWRAGEVGCNITQLASNTMYYEIVNKKTCGLYKIIQNIKKDTLIVFKEQSASGEQTIHVDSNDVGICCREEKKKVWHQFYQT